MVRCRGTSQQRTVWWYPCCGLGGFFGSLFYVADMEGNASFASTDNHVRHFRFDDPKDVCKCRSIA